jgi:hypothetical protein
LHRDKDKIPAYREAVERGDSNPTRFEKIRMLQQKADVAWTPTAVNDMYLRITEEGVPEETVPVIPEYGDLPDGLPENSRETVPILPDQRDLFDGLPERTETPMSSLA